MYSVVRAILVSAPGLLAESYAGVALVKISGDAAPVRTCSRCSPGPTHARVVTAR